MRLIRNCFMSQAIEDVVDVVYITRLVNRALTENMSLIPQTEKESLRRILLRMVKRHRSRIILKILNYKLAIF